MLNEMKATQWRALLSNRVGLLERLKELNGYSAGIITDTHSTMSPPPQKEFSTTSISANVLSWLNCSSWVPSWKTKYSPHYFLKCYTLKTGGISTLYCAVPASTQRTIWWLRKDLLKVKRQIVGLPAFTNPRAQPLQFGNTELLFSHFPKPIFAAQDENNTTAVQAPSPSVTA